MQKGYTTCVTTYAINNSQAEYLTHRRLVDIWIVKRQKADWRTPNDDDHEP